MSGIEVAVLGSRLIQLHEPTGPAEATIVAINGLGDARETWTNRETQWFWLGDGLPQDLPNCRVFAFAFDDTNPNLDHHATSLHEQPKSRLEHEPVVFVAHDLGGTIVKSLLKLSSQSHPSLVLRHTAKILFFGTRHRTVTNIHRVEASSIIDMPGVPVGAELQAASQSYVEQGVDQAWLSLTPDINIFNFYETRPMRWSRRLIVSKEDATMDIPNERIVALDGSHEDMVQFSTKDSPSYRTVLQHLKITRVDRSPTPQPSNGALEQEQGFDFIGHLHLFEDGSLVKEQPCPLSDLQTKSLRGLLQANSSPDRDSLVWVHMPLNNTSWVNPCLQNLARDLGTELHIIQDKYWRSNERKSRKDTPHSRHFQPSGFSIQPQGGISQAVVYLPYLHWDSFDSFDKRSKYLGAPDSQVPDGWSEQTKAAYRAMKANSRNSPWHPRRTLDQFYYSSLPETKYRDKDQVVSKNTKDSRGGKKMVMVDQLWLWFLEGKDQNSYIFTCFPPKDEETEDGERDLEAVADLRRAILDEVNSRGFLFSMGTEFVALVVKQAMNVMLKTEEQTTYFRKFQQQLDSSSAENEAYQSMKRDEVKLALELNDIIDELNSLNRLLDVQKDVLEGMDIDLGPGFGRRLGHGYIEEYKKQLERMTDDAERTKKGLMDLLDLQQKEESLREAQYSNQQAASAREQADQTAAQSQILLLFTVVTIVFLPLSFFTSYYGMNVREFTGEAGNTNLGEVWEVMGPFSGGIIFVLLGAAFVMYWRAQRELKKRKALEKRKEERYQV